MARGFWLFSAFVDGDLRELGDVDLREILRAGDAGPAGTGSVRHAAGEDEAGLRVLVIGEQTLGVGETRGLVRLRNVAGAQHAFLLADVDRLLDPGRALARTEVGRLRDDGVDRQVVLRSLHQRRQVRVVACFLRRVVRFVHRRLETLVVQLARRGRSLLLTVPDVDGDLLVVLHQVDRDRRIRPARRGSFAAVERHFDGIRLRHVQDFVGERFDLVSGIHDDAKVYQRGGAAVASYLQSLLRIDVCVRLHAPRDAEALRISVGYTAAAITDAVAAGSRRHSGSVWRRADGARPVHQTGRIHPLGRNGGRLLPATCTARVLADPERRRAGGPLSVSCGCSSAWPVQVRSASMRWCEGRNDGRSSDVVVSRQSSVVSRKSSVISLSHQSSVIGLSHQTRQRTRLCLHHDCRLPTATARTAIDD